METTKLPTIPTVVITANKGNEVETFESFRDFEDWFLDECDKDIYSAYKDADHDDRAGCDGPSEWVRETFDFELMQHFLEQGKGWKIERVSK